MSVITNTIHYIDQTSEKGHHMVFNSSMIKVLQICFPQHHLLYWGIDSNQQATLELLDTKNKLNCTLKTLHYKNTKRSFVGVKLLFFLNKEIKRAKNFHSILKQASPNDTLFLSITTFSSFLVFKYLHYFNPKPTVAVLHGDIDFFYLFSLKMEILNVLIYKQNYFCKSRKYK